MDDSTEGKNSRADGVLTQLCGQERGTAGLGRLTNPTW